MSEVGQTLLAIAAALVVPGLWGWAVYWIYRRFVSNRFLPPVGEPTRASANPPPPDREEWSYQI
jgi:hypothetical protein